MDHRANFIEGRSYLDDFLPLPIEEHGLVLDRDPEDKSGSPKGKVKTNVPHFAEQGSPGGFDFGYGGSGAHDLALNAVEYLVRHLAVEGDIVEPVRYYTAENGGVFKGKVSSIAFRFAHDFKDDFIVNVPDDTDLLPKVVEYQVLRSWLLSKLRDEPGLALMIKTEPMKPSESQEKRTLERLKEAREIGVLDDFILKPDNKVHRYALKIDGEWTKALSLNEIIDRHSEVAQVITRGAMEATFGGEGVG